MKCGFLVFFCCRSVSAINGDGGCVQIPIFIFGNIFPLPPCTTKIDSCKATVREGHPADARHARRYRDALKAGATTEYICADARHAVGNGDALKASTIMEGIIADVCHAIRNSDARKVGATFEGLSADACHAVGYRDAREVGAILEGPITDARHAIRDRNTRKAFAIHKGLSADACHWEAIMCRRDGNIRGIARIVGNRVGSILQSKYQAKVHVKTTRCA